MAWFYAMAGSSVTLVEMMPRLLPLDEGGYITTDDNCLTSKVGIFACGDCRKKLLRQVVTAAGDGATAAFACQHYLGGAV